MTEQNASWAAHLQHQLDQLANKQLLRRRGGGLTVVEPAPSLAGNSGFTNPSDSLGPAISATLPLIDFGSNDYLGLRQSPAVRNAVLAQLKDNGWGSGASSILTGWQSAHAQLERELAGFSGQQSAILFSSGYAANLGSLACLLDQQTVAFSDSLNHASLIDGLRLGRAERVIYPHCDMGQLQQLLATQRPGKRRALIVTESVFSMD
jgi:7-keto-8-aminopelargonate synthetase-like enzyme